MLEKKIADLMSETPDTKYYAHGVHCRIKNILRNIGVETIGQLLLHSKRELLSTPNFGPTSFAEIERMLAHVNIKLAATDVNAPEYNGPTASIEPLQTMQLHQHQRFDRHTSILRVPGGWIYEFYDLGGCVVSSSFVPFNDEFKDGARHDGKGAGI